MVGEDILNRVIWKSVMGAVRADGRQASGRSTKEIGVNSKKKDLKTKLQREANLPPKDE